MPCFGHAHVRSRVPSRTASWRYHMPENLHNSVQACILSASAYGNTHCGLPCTTAESDDVAFCSSFGRCSLDFCLFVGAAHLSSLSTFPCPISGMLNMHSRKIMRENNYASRNQIYSVRNRYSSSRGKCLHNESLGLGLKSFSSNLKMCHDDPRNH